MIVHYNRLSASKLEQEYDYVSFCLPMYCGAQVWSDQETLRAYTHPRDGIKSPWIREILRDHGHKQVLSADIVTSNWRKVTCLLCLTKRRR
jgi:hypothetical protein